MPCGRDTLFCHWYAHHVLCEGSQGDRDDPSCQLLEGLPLPPQGTEGKVGGGWRGWESGEEMGWNVEGVGRVRSREGKGMMEREGR